MVNSRLKQDFKLYLEREKEKSTSATSYSNITTIFFYEWSTMDKGAKVYSSSDSFFKFCEDSNITISESDKRVVKFARSLYCTCRPGQSVLMTAYTHYGLSTMLKDSVSTSKY